MTIKSAPVASSTSATNVKSSVSELTPEELRAHVSDTRALLAGTLDALEDKANLPKQFKKSATKRAAQLRTLRKEKPLVFAAVIAGGVVVTAGIIALVVNGVTKR